MPPIGAVYLLLLLVVQGRGAKSTPSDELKDDDWLDYGLDYKPPEKPKRKKPDLRRVK